MSKPSTIFLETHVKEMDEAGSKTIKKNNRYQKLMMILKKMKNRRNIKVIKVPKTAKPENISTERYRFVTDTGDIKWGFTASNGHFQVMIFYQQTKEQLLQSCPE